MSRKINNIKWLYHFRYKGGVQRLTICPHLVFRPFIVYHASRTAQVANLALSGSDHLTFLRRLRSARDTHQTRRFSNAHLFCSTWFGGARVGGPQPPIVRRWTTGSGGCRGLSAKGGRPSQESLSQRQNKSQGNGSNPFGANRGWKNKPNARHEP